MEDITSKAMLFPWAERREKAEATRGQIMAEFEAKDGEGEQ